MADRCRIVIEAVLKYAQELLGSNTNLNLPADLKVPSLDTNFALQCNNSPCVLCRLKKATVD